MTYSPFHKEFRSYEGLLEAVFMKAKKSDKRGSRQLDSRFNGEQRREPLQAIPSTLPKPCTNSVPYMRKYYDIITICQDSPFVNTIRLVNFKKNR